jgi:hypothetical protein
MSKAPTQFPKLTRNISLLVAGHRPERLGERGAAALARLDMVLDRFAQCTDPALAATLFGPDLYTEGPCVVRVLTGNSEGVDAHARARAAKPDLSLQLVDAAEPADDDSAEGSVHFGCPAAILEQDDSAHALRDGFALLHADVLVAVWDGDAPRGRAGGVVRLIQLAIEVGTPVLWIDLDGQLRELDYTLINGKSRFQHANSVFRHTPQEGAAVFGPAIDEPLTPAIRTWLDPLHCAPHQTPDRQTKMLRLYAQEQAPRSWRERSAGLIDRICCALASRNLAKLKSAFASDPTDCYEGIPEGIAIPPSLRERFAWSDVRANIASGRHRSGVWLLYLLAAFAVMAAVAGALHLGVAHEGWSTYLWPLGEGIILLAILSIVFSARKNQWHARWLGQRLMAEQLRYLAMTRPFLGVTMFFSLPLFRYDQRLGRAVLQHAEAWLLRRALITEGLPGTLPGYNLHRADQAALAGSLRTMIGSPTGGQIKYHTTKAGTMQDMHKTMHGAARWLFGLSLAAVAFHFVVPLLGLHHIGALLFATAFFPALAASLHGIQTKLEIARVESLSHQTKAELTTIRAVIDEYLDVPHANPWQQTLYLRAAALRAAQIMSEEAQSWRDLIAQQDTELPA